MKTIRPGFVPLIASFLGVVQYVTSILGGLVDRSAAAVNSKFSSMYGLLVSYDIISYDIRQ